MSGPVYRYTKRLLDIIGSIVGLCIFAILYIPVGLAIKLSSKGPVLVGLERVSWGRVITLYKFRSMVKDAHLQNQGLRESAHNERGDGPFFKMKHDPRLTRVGKIIRKFRIDEVPQFINVFKGELSLVGPRPHELNEVKKYPAEYQFLPKAKGGVTGLSQVNGASSLPYLKELELDSYYLKHQSLWLDLKIIGKTVAILFFDPTAI